jgi:aminoglycoside 2'-N-acetyltransferase I
LPYGLAMPAHPTASATLQVAHTSALPASTLTAAQLLLAEVFGDDLDEHDWDHSLGGIHALVWESQRLIAHGAVVQRRIIHRERALRTGYVEGVAVHPEHRRRGHGATVMAALERAIAGAYELGALAATELGSRLYLARGWRQWQGSTHALTPAGTIRTAEEDDRAVHVFETSVPLDLHGALTCDWRDGELW